MNEQQKQLIERLKQAQNVLVTVSKSPSVDALAAAIGLALALNKLDKHATAVYSGQTPSTIGFLKPEETLEENTDSLRDFIIALDKSKADKLRYKVEDEVVRIFITPYRTSISQDDLDFSQGDFNVDVVVALGVHMQQDLDEAVQTHGRILHDATVATLSTDAQQTELGSINWVEQGASSLSEMVTQLVEGLGKKVIDNQIATALLTGIVATTDRFSNDRTTPNTMSVSSTLMAAGANQQLISTELAAPERPQEIRGDRTDEPPQPPREPGTLEIEHEEDHQIEVDEQGQLIVPVDETARPPQPPDPQSRATTDPEPDYPKITGVRANPIDSETTGPQLNAQRERMSAPPSIDSTLTASAEVEAPGGAVEELTLPPISTPLLSHNQNVLAPDSEQPDGQPAGQPAPAAQMPPPPPPPPAEPMPYLDSTAPVPTIIPDDKTLSEIETEIESPHLHNAQAAAESLDDARSAVEAAFAQPAAEPDAPAEQPTATSMTGSAYPLPPQPQPFSEPLPGNSPADMTLDMPMPQAPPSAFPAAPPAAPSAFPGMPPQQPGQTTGPQAPPVPPPFIPPV